MSQETTRDYLKRETSEYASDMFSETLSYLTDGETTNKWDVFDLDEEGWSIVNPSEDSRLVYVATDGDDDEAALNQYGRRYYLPSDPVIGGDPSAPAQPDQIKAYKTIWKAANVVRGSRWIEEKYDATDGITYDEYNEIASSNQNFTISELGYPDWILFKRGQTFPLENYYEHFRKPDGSPGVYVSEDENNLFKVLMLGGTKGFDQHGIDYNAGYFGGRSTDERAVITAWSAAGDHSETRPVLEDHLIRISKTHGNVVVSSIDCTVDFYTGTDPRWWDYDRRGIRNILVEDCPDVNGDLMNRSTFDGLHVRRCRTVDYWNENRGSGFYISVPNVYINNLNPHNVPEQYIEKTTVCMEECVFDNNGRQQDPNEPVTWNLSGTGTPDSGPFNLPVGQGHQPKRDVYSRNVYGAYYKEFLFRGNIVGRNAGGGSVQMRAGGVAERNVFLWNDSGTGVSTNETPSIYWNNWLCLSNGFLGFDPYRVPRGANEVAAGAGLPITVTAVIADNISTNSYDFNSGGAIYSVGAKGDSDKSPGYSRAKEFIMVDNHNYSPGGRRFFIINNTWDVVSIVVKNNFSLYGQPSYFEGNYPHPVYVESSIGWIPYGKSGLTFDISNNTFAVEESSPYSLVSGRTGGIYYSDLHPDTRIYGYKNPFPLSYLEQDGFGSNTDLIHDVDQFITDAGWTDGVTAASYVTYMESIDPNYVANENIYVDDFTTGTKQTTRISYWKTLTDGVSDENGVISGKFTEALAKKIAKEYHAFLTFIYHARENRKGEWNSDYTADAINNYFREKFGKELVGGTYSNENVNQRVLPFIEEYGQTLPAGSTLELESTLSSDYCHESSSWTGDTGENWTELTPSEDSRLVYVATDGDDDQAISNQHGRRYYLPDDPEIGPDPTRPIGPIKAYATIAKATIPVRGTNWTGVAHADGVTYDVYDRNRQYSEFPDGFPDWLLLRRGQTFDEDFSETLGIETETSKNILQIAMNQGGINGSIYEANIKGFFGGRSETERAVITSWGDSWEEPRPRLFNDITLRYNIGNLAIVSIAAPSDHINSDGSSEPRWYEKTALFLGEGSGDFTVGETVSQIHDVNNRKNDSIVNEWDAENKILIVTRIIDPDITGQFYSLEDNNNPSNVPVTNENGASYQITAIEGTISAPNILVEDCSGVRFGEMNTGRFPNFVVRRSLINDLETGNYHGSGMFVAAGEEPSRIQPTTVVLEECILDNNGWADNPLDARYWGQVHNGKPVPWNHVGNAHSPRGDNLNRNIYAASYDSLHIRGCMISRSAGAGSLQLRVGGVVERCCFIMNSMHGGGGGSNEAFEPWWKSTHNSDNVYVNFQPLHLKSPANIDIATAIVAYEGSSFVFQRNIITKTWRHGTGAELLGITPKKSTVKSRASDGSHVIVVNNQIHSDSGRHPVGIYEVTEDGIKYKIQNLVFRNNNIWQGRANSDNDNLDLRPYDIHELGNWKFPVIIQMGKNTSLSPTGNPEDYENGIGYTWDIDANKYFGVDPDDIWFRSDDIAGGYEELPFAQWQSFGFDPNTTLYQTENDFAYDAEWSDPDRSILTYMESIDPTYVADENVKVDAGAIIPQDGESLELWKVISTDHTSNYTYSINNPAELTNGWIADEAQAKLQAKNYHAFLTFIERARNNRKGAWRSEYTTEAFNNYIREGFGLEAISGDYGPSDPDIRNAPLMEAYGFIEASSCVGEIDDPDHTVGASGGTFEFNLNLNDEGCTWEASSDSDWLTLDSTSGSGDSTISYSIDENTLNATRTGNISVSGKTHTVTQTGVSCQTIGLSSTSYSAGYTADSGVTFSIDMSAEDCPWTISTDVIWIDLLGVVSGEGDAIITYNIDANTLNASRTGKITIGGLTHTINQAGVPCQTIGLSSTSYSAGYTADSGVKFSIDMNANDCPWTITTDADWIDLLGVASGSGDATITYDIAENQLNAPRTAEISIGGLTHTVTQTGVSCETISISPFLERLSANSHTGLTFEVDMSAEDCGWNVTTGATWIDLRGLTSGSGDTIIPYDVDENTLNATRSDTISIGGLTLTVQQDGVVCSVTQLTPNTHSAGYTSDSGLTFDVDVTAEDCKWTATTSNDWINLGTTQGTGDETITYGFTENTLNATRIGTISVTSGSTIKTFTITQTGVECETIGITPDAYSAGASAETGVSFGITMSAEDCEWGATTDADWITLGVTSGSGNASITYDIDANILNAPRTAEISIGGLTHTVSQIGVTCETIGISPDAYLAGASAETGVSFTIDMSAEDCTWLASSNQSWVTLNTTSGSGDATITYDIDANTSKNSRTAQISIGGLTHSITQNGVVCETVGITPDAYSAGASAETGVTFGITMSAEDCSWSASTDASWITINTPTSGSGNETITYNIAANTLNAPRTGEISIGGLTHTVSQIGVTCETISITPDAYSAGYTAQSNVSFTVNMSAEDCGWGITTEATWITIGITSGSGDASITYDIAENDTTAPRTGEISIGGLTHTVSQSALVCEVIGIDPESRSKPSSGGTGSFGVSMSNQGCTWLATESESWITLDVSSGTGDGYVEYTIDSNASETQRIGEISIGGLTHTITQAGSTCEVLLLDPSFDTIDSDGGTLGITIDMSDDSCSWGATTDELWITLGVTSGTGDDTLEYFVSENTTIVDRYGEIYVSSDTNGLTHGITQFGVVCGISSIDPTSYSTNALGSTNSFGVSMNNQSCTWVATESESWITLDVSSATGDGYVEYTIDSNPSSNARTGEINVGEFTHTISQSGTTCDINSINPTGYTAGYTAETGLTFYVDMSAEECPWTASTSEDWITIHTTSGIGDSIVRYDITKNPVDSGSRVGEISIEGLTFTIEQSGHVCQTLSISSTSNTVARSGGTASFDIDMSDEDCGWIAQTSASWITINTASGNGDSTITYTIAPHTVDVGDRVGEISVGGLTHTVTQSGHTCETLSISSSSNSFDSSGGTGSFDIDLNDSDCPWSASSEEDWISLDKSSGNGDSTITYTISQNILNASRTGDISVNGFTHTISQSGVTCETVGITPDNYSAGASAETGVSFTLDMSAEDCGWNATTDALWITLGITSGTGDASITYDIDENILNAPRTGEISIGGLTHTVSQAGVTCSVVGITPDSFTPSGYTAGTGSFDIDMSAEDCDWSVSTEADWITIGVTTGTGDATVGYTFSENDLAVSRVGEISVGGFTHTITQPADVCSASIDPQIAVWSFGITGLGWTGGTFDTSITMSNQGCTWEISVIYSLSGATLPGDPQYDGRTGWIEFSATSGTGNATVTYTISPSVIVNSRNATVSINEQSQLVFQEQAPTYLYGITPSSTSVGYTGISSDVDNRQSFELDAVLGSNFHATTDSDWINIHTPTYFGDYTIFYSVEENPFSYGRTGEILVSRNFGGGLEDDQIFTITQEGVGECNVVSVIPVDVHVGFEGATGLQFDVVMTSQDCEWAVADTDPEWVEITSGRTGTGNATITYGVTANPEPGDGRFGTVSIVKYTEVGEGNIYEQSVDFTVYQDAVDCSVTEIVPHFITLQPQASLAYNSFYVNVLYEGCPWVATSSDDWIVLSKSSGEGDGSVFYAVTENRSTADRTGYIQIDGLRYNITQLGYSSYEVVLTSSRADVSYSSSTGSVGVIVSGEGELEWTATASNDWITITSGATGTDDGTITYSLAENNTGSLRYGTIEVSVPGSPNVVYTINQDLDYGDPIDNQPTNQNYIYPTYYKFVIKEMPQLEYFITKVTLPSFGYDSAIEQPNRFSLIRHPASKIVYAPLEMSFLVNEDMTNWLEISNWIRRTSVSDDHIDILDDTGEHFTQGTLFITNSAMNPNIEVTFYNMFPISVSGFEFDSQVTDLTPWTANVTFAYDYYDIKKL